MRENDDVNQKSVEGNEQKEKTKSGLPTALYKAPQMSYGDFKPSVQDANGSKKIY